jgi:hypothetical protein
MLETATFPVANCGPCGREVLVGHELDERDELIGVCTRCGTALAQQTGFRMLGSAALRGLGYDVDPSDGGGGCGSGGCSSCGTSSCAA